MTKKCKKCKVPLEGLGYKISHFLFRIEPSKKNPELCNKCEKK